MPDLCGAKKRQTEGTCKHEAGWGTDHPGFGRCRVHGGNTTTQRTGAAKEEAAAEAARLGVALDVDPAEALTEIVRLDAGEEAFLRARIAALRDSQLVDKNGSIHPTIRAWRESRDRQARHAKLALDAGVDERRLRLVEDTADAVSIVLQLVTGDLELSADQQARLPSVMAKHLPRLDVITSPPKELTR